MKRSLYRVVTLILVTVLSSGLMLQRANAAGGQVIVATSGGDYTTISAALAAITPTAANPYVIQVMPGTYTENITMKSYVDLRGAGAEVTVIQATGIGSDVITISSLTNVGIYDLTIKGGRFGIYNSSSSPMIDGNIITGNGSAGIYNTGASPTIQRNAIKGNGVGISNNSSSTPIINGNVITGNTEQGIYNNNNCTATISGNTIDGNTKEGVYSSTSMMIILGNRITNNGFTGVSISSTSTAIYGSRVIGNTVTGNGHHGIWVSADSPTISGNTVTYNNRHGVGSSGSFTSPKIIHNRITDNSQSGGYADVYMEASATPNVSFNIYNTSSGAGAVGKYNVKPDGTVIN